MNRLQKKLQRRLVKAMSGWQDPHMDKPLTESSYVQAVNISEEGSHSLSAITSTLSLLPHRCTRTTSSPR